MRVLARALCAIALAVVAPCALAMFLPPAQLIVVSDGNYPPYLFRGEDGQLRGAIRDRWDAWSRVTGVPVRLEGTEWALAQAQVRDGEADVIAAFAFNEERGRSFEFGRGRMEPMEARVFVHRSLGGLHDLAGLRGMAVGAKAGSACGQWLLAHGVRMLQTYADSRQLVEAASFGEVRLFCMDAPIGRYLLVEQGLHEQFHESPPLYTTTLDWAVRRGRSDLRDFIQRGFDRIPAAELEAIDARWNGAPLRGRVGDGVLFFGVLAAAAAVMAAAVLAVRFRGLRRRNDELSRHDAATGLPNRAALDGLIAEAIAAARGSPVALLLVSIDSLKAVNDAYGPHVADRLLRESAMRVADCLAAGDVVGSAGGAEFAIVLPAAERFEDGTSVARRVLAAMQAPCEIEGERIYASASIGIATHPADADTPARLFQNASIALSRARQGRGEGFRVFKPEMQASAAGRMQLEAALHGALERGEFVVHYQPRYETGSGAVVGFEALLRWNHPQKGVVSPAEFIPVLEETGAIADVGEWVFRRVCEQIRDWERGGLQPLPVAVNLSASQFRDRSLDVTVARAITETGVNAGLLELELTESSLMQEPEEAARMLRHLEGYGVKLSIDDFGTGYSSLAYLKRFPLDALKIDRTFVRDATTDPDDAAITKAIIQLAHTLGLRVVAEGVETKEQRELLLALECDEVQGFLFARPMPAEEAGRLLLPALSTLRRA